MLYQRESPHGGDVYGDPVLLDFSVNVNPLGMPKGVLAAVEEALPRLSQYPDPYCRRLVGKLAVRESVPTDWILCGNGAAELIYAYCQALKPKKAVELAPTFSEYSRALEGCDIERYPLRQSGGFVLDEAFLHYLKDTWPETVFLCNPNNPTGRLIPEPLLEKILSFCKEKNIRVFLDECFLELSDRPQNRAGLLKKYENLLILKAFTKTYAMAGLRLGYCLTADVQLLRAMAERLQPWNVSIPAQAAGVAALREKEYLQETREMLDRERLWLTRALRNCGLWVCPSEANFILFHGKEGLDRLVRQKGIAIRSCSNFHGLGRGWYRIAVRSREENEALLSALAQCCEKE